MKTTLNFFLALILLISCDVKKDNKTDVYTTNNRGDTLVYYQTQDGLKNGKFIIYYPTGEIKVEGRLKNDNFDGVLREFYENGELKKYRFFEDSILLYEKKFDLNGNYSGGRTAFEYPTNMFDTRKIYLGDSINIGAKIVHSMFDKVKIGMCIVNITNNKRDTLFKEVEEEMIINWWYKPTTKGEKNIEISLFEISFNDAIFGHKIDTANIVVQD
jgi:hypothetical protein